ncbi:hypothetical protein Bbelb_018600 [Branchiostoma belcheri]|nr:hypothetical protein Bbelb_018600 [Branchiostoma belcheri]
MKTGEETEGVSAGKDSWTVQETIAGALQKDFMSSESSDSDTDRPVFKVRRLAWESGKLKKLKDSLVPAKGTPLSGDISERKLPYGSRSGISVSGTDEIPNRTRKREAPACRRSFTLNNYGDDDLARLRNIDPAAIKFMVVGAEVSPTTGTPHLQGYVNFSRKVRTPQVKGHLGDRCHVEKAVGNDHDNERYCSKDGNVVVRMGHPIRQGQRNDLTAATNFLRENDGDLSALAQEMPETFPARDFLTRCFVFVGPPGCGKSRLLREYLPDDTTTYYKPEGGWFDGYMVRTGRPGGPTQYEPDKRRIQYLMATPRLMTSSELITDAKSHNGREDEYVHMVVYDANSGVSFSTFAQHLEEYRAGSLQMLFGECQQMALDTADAQLFADFYGVRAIRYSDVKRSCSLNINNNTSDRQDSTTQQLVPVGPGYSSHHGTHPRTTAIPSPVNKAEARTVTWAEARKTRAEETEEETPGPDFRGLDAFLEKNATVANIQYTPTDMDQFMKNVYLPFIDNIVESLQRRFPGNVLLSAFNILKISSIHKCCRTEVEGLEEVESEYSVLSTLLETSYNTLSTTQVLHKVQEVHGDTPCQTWQNCERGFSTMKRVKTPLRNRLKEETLNNLLMISIFKKLRTASSHWKHGGRDHWKPPDPDDTVKVVIVYLPGKKIIIVKDVEDKKYLRSLVNLQPKKNTMCKVLVTASNFNTSANKLKANVKDSGNVIAGQQLEQDPRYSVDEIVCCHEQVPGILCITEHHGFQTVCQDEDVLETAHNGYQDQYGGTLGERVSIQPAMCKRYTAYRQFVEWCYQYLGRNVRVPLPSCAVTAIRRAFFSVDYTGFMEANQE